jgi:protein gp37
MSENSKIEWTDHTFNPWIGCTHKSPGCVNCYAEARDERFAKGQHWGKGAPRQRTTEANWKLPLKWNHQAEWDLAQAFSRRPRVFCASLADWLDDEVPIEWLAVLLELIRLTPNLDWLLLTKRPENWKSRMTAVLRLKEDEGRALADHIWLLDWISGESAPANVWMGTSVEDQKRADERIPLLLGIPAGIHFLSCEPLIGPLLLGEWIPRNLCPRIDWAIIGGESGPGARICDVRWVRALVNQFRYASVACFVKQLGATSIEENAAMVLGDRKGGDPSEWPEDLRVREFPKAEVVAA